MLAEVDKDTNDFAFISWGTEKMFALMGPRAEKQFEELRRISLNIITITEFQMHTFLLPRLKQNKSETMFYFS